MKNTFLTFATSAVLTATVMIAGNAASAEDLPQTKLHQQLSVTQGFDNSELPVLQRAAAVDPNKISSDLIRKLGLAGAYQNTKLGTRLHITGRQWSLDVAGDGSAAEYRDLAVEARSHSLAKPLSEQMPAAELEQKGRAFIASKLASHIVLGSGEELVAVRADYRTDGGQDLTTGEITNAVSGNRIVFGRTLNGVPVVGNGSKVILTFSNDGSLESFRYDWPTYQAGAPQKIADAGQLLLRVQKVVAVRSGNSAAASSAPVPASGAEAYPVTLNSNTQLQALDCGYYDAGSMSGHTQSIQPGCTYLAVSQGSNGTRDGYAGAVPAGSPFALDQAWLETKILSGN